MNIFNGFVSVYLCILQKSSGSTGSSSSTGLEVQQQNYPSPKATSRLSSDTTLGDSGSGSPLAQASASMKAKFAEEVKKREDLQKELGLQVKSNYLGLKSASSTDSEVHLFIL